MEMALVDSQVGRSKVSGNHQGEANSVSKVKEDRDGAGSVALWGQVSQKEQWPLPALLCETKLSLKLSLMPDNSLPPCMFLEHFQLLPQCWSSE